MGYYDDDGSVSDSDDETSDDSLRQVGQTESSQEVHDLGASSDLPKLGESVDAEKKKEKKQKKKKQKVGEAGPMTVRIYLVRCLSLPTVRIIITWIDLPRRFPTLLLLVSLLLPC